MILCFYQMEEAMNNIAEKIQEEVDSHLSAIKYNLTNVIQGLLFSLVIENEKQGNVGDISDLVRLIVDTTHYTGRKGEEYPDWVINKRIPDKKEKEQQKQAKAIIKRLETLLQSHGIKQYHNYGK